MRGRFTLPVLVIILLLSWATTSSSPFGQTPSPAASEKRSFTRAELSHGQKYVPDEVLVRFKPGTSRRAMLPAHARIEGRSKGALRPSVACNW